MNNEIYAMSYCLDHEPCILVSDTYNGYKFYVVTYWSHPCAYVAIPKDHPLYGKDYENIGWVVCHGGLTFSGALDFIKDDYLIGWDYMHLGDYCQMPYSYNDEGRKWTVEEIVDECKHVIDQLID